MAIRRLPGARAKKSVEDDEQKTNVAV